MGATCCKNNSVHRLRELIRRDAKLHGVTGVAAAFSAQTRLQLRRQKA